MIRRNIQVFYHHYTLSFFFFWWSSSPVQREAMLKSLNLTSHAKARERNAGFWEETADICSLPPPLSLSSRFCTERGGSHFASALQPETFFPQFLSVFLPLFWWTFWFDSPVSLSLCALSYKIGDSRNVAS
jgi:hypothetical protein